MHLFSTRSWHIVHWDPVITIVFPEFLSTSIYRCGTVGFGVLILIFFIWFQHLPVLYHNHSCILHYRSLSLLSQSTQLVPNFTYVQVVCGLWYADWQHFSGLQYCSCKRNTLSQIFHRGSKWHRQWQESELDSGQSHIHSDNSVVSFFTWTHAGS